MGAEKEPLSAEAQMLRRAVGRPDSDREIRICAASMPGPAHAHDDVADGDHLSNSDSSAFAS